MCCDVVKHNLVYCALIYILTAWWTDIFMIIFNTSQDVLGIFWKLLNSSFMSDSTDLFCFTRQSFPLIVLVSNENYNWAVF